MRRLNGTRVERECGKRWRSTRAPRFQNRRGCCWRSFFGMVRIACRENERRVGKRARHAQIATVVLENLTGGRMEILGNHGGMRLRRQGNRRHGGSEYSDTIRPRDGQGSHARGPPDQSDFPAEGEGTESPEMSGGLQNCRNTIERPPEEILRMDLGCNSYFLAQIDQQSKPTRSE